MYRELIRIRHKVKYLCEGQEDYGLEDNFAYLAPVLVENIQEDIIELEQKESKLSNLQKFRLEDFLSVKQKISLKLLPIS